MTSEAQAVEYETCDPFISRLEDNLVGEFAELRGRGGPGDEHASLDGRIEWERRLAEGGVVRGHGADAPLDTPVRRGG